MLGSIISAGASLLGGILGHKGQKDANETNMQLGREQMQFQERMSNTSYQRGVKDMQEAGLNPMLAYSQGGASAPMGSLPQVQNAAGAGVASAKGASDSVLALQQLESNKAQIEQTKAMTSKIQSETMERNLNTAKLIADTEHVVENVDLRAAQAASERAKWRGHVADSGTKMELYDQGLRQKGFAADVARRKAESALAQLEIPKSKAEASFYEDLGKANPYLKQLLMLLKGGSSAASILRK